MGPGERSTSFRKPYYRPAMNFGTFDDIVVLEQTVAKLRLLQFMLLAEPGCLRTFRWNYGADACRLSRRGVPDEARLRHLFGAAP